MKIDAREYLIDSLNFSQQEILLRESFLDWLPDQIIDCHVHCNLKKHSTRIDDDTYKQMMSTFPSFTLRQSNSLRTLLYSNKTVRSLRFPLVWRDIDHKEANAYLLKNSPEEDRAAVYGIPNDILYTETILNHRRTSALKMYPRFFIPPAQKIYQYFPPEILDVAEGLGIPIILHLPKVITQCIDELMKLTDDFPHLTVVLAHLGLPHLPVPGLQQTYELAARHTRVFMDTAMIPSTEVICMAIAAFGPDRILFGSDEPLNLIRAQVYENPILGQRLITLYPYHWVDKNEHKQYKHLASDVTHMHWGALIALRDAITKSYNSLEQKSVKEKIFYDNAKEVYGF